MDKSDEQKWYDYQGNSHKFWMESADSLFFAWRILRAQRNLLGVWSTSAWQFDRSYFGKRFSNTLMPELMIVSYTIEVLLKGLIAKNGVKLAENGKYIGPKTHNLIKLSNGAGYSLSIEQKKVLEFLSVVITSIGRYPIGTSSNEKLDNWKWSSEEEELLVGLIGDLLNKLNA